jgi:hypothetical protein
MAASSTSPRTESGSFAAITIPRQSRAIALPANQTETIFQLNRNRKDH